MTEWCDIDRNNNGNRGSICCPNAGMVWRCFSLLYELVFFFSLLLFSTSAPHASHFAPPLLQYAADIVIFQQWNVQGSTRACDESSGSLSLPDCVDSSGNKYSG